MIRVTAGSSNSYSLRVLQQCIQLLPHEEQAIYKFYRASSFMDSLNSAMSEMNTKDILLNLPADKSEFIIGNKKYLGHTDYFRKFYKLEQLAMCFKGNNSNLLLLTDHIPLKDVTESLNVNVITKKIELAIGGFKCCHREINSVLLLSINPHAGENGLLGTEEKLIYSKAIEALSKKLTSVHFDIVPSDGFFLKNKFSKDSLVVSPYHDQGLSIFKALNGFAGNHLTFGLPYLRMSPIHGTAKGISYNDFNPTGIIYTLLDALKLHKSD